MLLADQPSADSCPRSASLSPECLPKGVSSSSSDENELEAEAISPPAPSREESGQGSRLRDSLFSLDSQYVFEAVLPPTRTALEAALRYADSTEDDYPFHSLDLDPNPPPPLPPLSFDDPSISPSPLEFILDLDGAHDEETDDLVLPFLEATPTEFTITFHDHHSDHRIDLLLDLEFEDYSDVFKLSQKPIPPPYPGRRPWRQRWMDAVDRKVTYITSIITGE